MIQRQPKFLSGSNTATWEGARFKLWRLWKSALLLFLRILWRTTSLPHWRNTTPSCWTRSTKSTTCKEASTTRFYASTTKYSGCKNWEAFCFMLLCFVFVEILIKVSLTFKKIFFICLLWLYNSFKLLNRLTTINFLYKIITISFCKLLKLFFF